MYIDNILFSTIILIFVYLKSCYVRKSIFYDKKDKNYIVELDTLLFLMTPFIYLQQTSCLLTYTMFDLIFSLFFFVVLIFEKYYYRILNYHNLACWNQISRISASIKKLIEKRFFMMFIDAPIIPFLFIIKRYISNIKVPHCTSIIFFTIFIAAITSVFNTIYSKIVCKGSQDTKLLSYDIGILKYQLYEAIYSLIDNKRTNKISGIQITTENISKAKEIKTDAPKLFGACKGKSVITIQVEALQSFPLFMKLGNSEITPNLNKLALQSIFFRNFYSQVSQGTTSDAEIMLNTSLYPTENYPAAYKYCNKAFESLPKLLKRYGYTSAAFHANNIGFWNRDKLYDSLGFDNFYEENFFEHKDILGLGSSDEVLFDKALEIIYNKMTHDEKFYINLITLSSHYPFNIYRGDIDVPSDMLWMKYSLAGHYLSTINYVDSAIGKFVSNLETLKILDNCILVIYGDHFGITHSYLQGENNIEKKAIELILGRPFKIEDTFRVPCLIRLPNKEYIRDVKTVAGQIDLLPTLANLLGLDIKNFVHFGQDILNSEKNTLGFRYFLPAGSFINDKMFYVNDKRDMDEKTKKEVDKVLMLEKMSDIYFKKLPINKL